MMQQDEMVDQSDHGQLPDHDLVISFKPDKTTAEMNTSLAIMTDILIPEEEPTTQEQLPDLSRAKDVLVFEPVPLTSISEQAAKTTKVNKSNQKIPTTPPILLVTL